MKKKSNKFFENINKKSKKSKMKRIKQMKKC